MVAKAGLALMVAFVLAVQAPPATQKSPAVASIDAHAVELARLSDRVWA